MSVYENTELKRIFLTEREEIKAGGRKMHNEEFLNLVQLKII
jgi:hypothetical protein